MSPTNDKQINLLCLNLNLGKCFFSFVAGQDQQIEERML